MNRRLPACSLVGLSLCVNIRLYAQGMLPPQNNLPSAGPAAVLRIGDPVTDSMIVADLQGSARTLMSYKEPLNSMIVGFFSAGCPEDQAERADFRRLYDNYKTWGVTFVAVEGNSQEPAEDLAAALQKSRIPAGTSGLGVPVLRDLQGILARRFAVTKTPTLVIIDEGWKLRYRGPLGKVARQAIEAVISHQEPVDTPESLVTTGCPIQ